MELWVIKYYNSGSDTWSENWILLATYASFTALKCLFTAT